MKASGLISRLPVWSVAVIVGFGLCAPAYCQHDPDSGAVQANRITNVLSPPLDYLSGSMALHALTSALRSQGAPCRYMDVVAMSGALFKFVYDSTEAYEPLRDACPFDLLRSAAASQGFPDAHWETGKSLVEVKALIKREIDSGRPLVSPFLEPDAYHGLNIITGYDYDQGILLVKGAFDGRKALSIPIPDVWDGPTVSPAGWATNPVFILGEQVEDSTDLETVFLEMLTEGIALLRGGRLEYGRHEGEWRYMRSPGRREAWYGLPAYEVLIADVGDKDLLVRRSDRQVLNFGLVWRIDAMVGLLEHDRTYGAQFVAMLRAFVSDRQAWALEELGSNLERTRNDAARLRNMFWHEISDSLTDPEDVLAYVDSTMAMVFKLPDTEELPAELRSLGREVYECPWGTVIVEDSRTKRLAAKMVAIGIMSRERETLGLLEKTVELIQTRKDPTWPPRGYKPGRLREKEALR